METELITVPTFVFFQGKIGDPNWERPIHVEFYNGSICLRQEGEYAQMEIIQLLPEYVEALFKAIKKHKPDAEHFLKK